jgi:hypothetical protein
MRNLLLFLLFCICTVFNSRAGCRKDSMYSYEFNNGKLITSRNIFNYDNTGLVGETLQALVQGKWINLNKNIYNHNAAGLLASLVNQEWGPWTKTWRNQNRTEYTYNGQQKKIKESMSAWDTTNNLWINVEKIDYTLSANGRDSFLIVSYLQNMQWNPDKKAEFLYNSDGKVLYQTTYDWNGNSWVLIRRIRYTYNAGQLTEEVAQSRQSDQWVDFYRLVYTYDMGLQSNVLEQNRNGSEWVNSQKRDYTYDLSNCLNKIDYAYNWDDNDSAWTYHTQDSFFQVNTVGIHAIAADKNHIYPNPAHSELYVYAVSTSNYSFMDISGRVLKTGELVEGKNTIDINDLAPGIYLLRNGETTDQVRIE